MRLQVLVVALLAMGWSAGACGQQILPLGESECWFPPGGTKCIPKPPPNAESGVEWVCQYGQCRRPFDPGQICLNFGDAEHIACVDAPWHFSGTPILATVTSTTDTLLSLLRAEIAAAVADDDADTIATLEASLQAIKRRHPPRPQ